MTFTTIIDKTNCCYDNIPLCKKQKVYVYDYRV